MTASSLALYNRLLAKARLRHLQLLVLTAELGNTHKVAEAVGLSQPSVVKFLQGLESLIDMPLFERHARGMRPTAACRELLPTARAMLHLLARGAQSLGDLQSGASGVVHVGALPAACQGSIMSAVARFASTHPDIRFHLRESMLPSLLEDLATGVVDVLLIRQPALVPQGFRFDALQTDHTVVLARAGHALASARLIDLADLARQSWLTFPNSMTSRVIFDQWFEHAPERPRITNVTTASLSAILAMVAGSDALIVLPYSLAAPALAAGQVCALDVARQDDIRPLGVLWPHAAASAPVAVFCQWLLSRCELRVAAPRR